MFGITAAKRALVCRGGENCTDYSPCRGSRPCCWESQHIKTCPHVKTRTRHGRQEPRMGHMATVIRPHDTHGHGPLPKQSGPRGASAQTRTRRRVRLRSLPQSALLGRRGRRRQRLLASDALARLPRPRAHDGPAAAAPKPAQPAQPTSHPPQSLPPQPPLPPSQYQPPAFMRRRWPVCCTW